ncbi:O-antigen ligase family protein [Winogradskyella sp. DF17]|uniref:O-antigen ligase family protein n=1 Tax=Winogradskyella pelagia TaxID=2819984 RepID=A0ABS3T318_9FLAO|nr:O-antigen ligase family protein [Winogradskyella sp. DF17]MBO3116679.1 O-antigen ligase family protein [Winogradskyella sp. DF17]
MTETKYISQIIFHIILGLMMYYLSIFPSLYFYAVIGYFFFQVIAAPKNEKVLKVLMACCYIVGAEVIFRMTGAGLFYESSKYFIILFLLIGMFYSGLSNKAYPYFLVLIFLIPSIVIASIDLRFDGNLRKNVAFVLSGPVCLGISALYCYNKKLTLKQVQTILLYVGLPIVTLTTYLFLYTPSIKDIVTGTESNFATSGGFGPNQVSTVLGLGMFVFCSQFFLNSKNIGLKILNVAIFSLIAFRGIVTFSRGGVLTAILMIAAFLIMVYIKSKTKQKSNIIVYFISLIVIGTVIWTISSSQTSGLIDKRYSGKDKLGREKEDISAGRLDIFLSELEGFIDNPFLGVGANGMKEIRLITQGDVVASHNEMSRLLSEHGILGIIILLILIFKPLDMYAKNSYNIFFYAFLVFWFATINHSAMRIAAPGFIYGLALLNVTYDKRPIHRKRLASPR